MRAYSDKLGVSAEAMPTVYQDLRGLARSIFSEQPVGHTLQPTAVVHEAYLKLVRSSSTCESRAHLLAIAARVMRQILADYARRRGTLRRGGQLQRSATPPELPTDQIDPLLMHEALAALAQLDPRQAEVVELRFFSELSNAEIADVLGVSQRTIEREWNAAKAWLQRELRDLPQ